MNTLHIVHAGIDNGDIEELRDAHRDRRDIEAWTALKGVSIGDKVALYVANVGLFATAVIRSESRRSADRDRRYVADIGCVRLIKPPIPLTTIRQQVPGLAWAAYPRSVTTVRNELAASVENLIRERRSGVLMDLVQNQLADCSLEELRARAYQSIKKTLPVSLREVQERRRSAAIAEYVKQLAKGRCEGCGERAPFRTSDGRPYLETHHVLGVAADGADDPKNVVALCPNCHRRAEHSADCIRFNAGLARKLKRLPR